MNMSPSNKPRRRKHADINSLVVSDSVSPYKRKSLGQHFLTSKTVLDQIVQELAIAKDEHIIEIGAGDGALTELLAQTGARVTALEFDHRRIPLLIEGFTQYSNVRILEGDALSIDKDLLFQWEPDAIGLSYWDSADVSRVRMVGNLPYNIASQIILRFACCMQLSDLTFMIQRELAQRLCASSGGGDYGRFTLSVGFWRDSRVCFDIPPEAFTPAPKVVSSLIHCGCYRPMSDDVMFKAFSSLTHIAFAQRRKQLGNCLGETIEKAQLIQLGIDPKKRAEQLSIQQFLQIAKAMLVHPQRQVEKNLLAK